MKTKRIIGWVLAVPALISYVTGFIIIPMSLKYQEAAQKYGDEQIAQALVGGSVLDMAGRILFAIAIAFFASAKGRSWFWGLFGLVPLFGIIAVSAIKPRDAVKNMEPKNDEGMIYNSRTEYWEPSLTIKMLFVALLLGFTVTMAYMSYLVDQQ
jgi:hypothetical protein